MRTFLYPLSTPLFPLSPRHVLLKILVYFMEKFLRIIVQIYFLKVQIQITKKTEH